MKTIKSIFGVKDTPIQKFVQPERQSMEQTEDYATKKVVQTREINVGGINANPGLKVLNGSTIRIMSKDNSSSYAEIYNDDNTLPQIKITGNNGMKTVTFTSSGFGMGGAATSKVLFLISSTTQGSKPYPTMTTAQKNTLGGLNPTEGTCVYDSDLHKLCVWTGAAWETFTSA